MPRSGRIILTVIAVLVSWWSFNFLCLILVPTNDWHVHREVVRIIAVLCATAVGFLAWRLMGSSRTGLAKHAVIGAFVTGFIGFVAGFIGPMIFEPSANQGPLLGIFFTGPLGFLAGGIGGIIYSLTCRKPG